MIRVNEPEIGQRELELVSRCVQSGWVSSQGPFIEQFEKEWADYCGRAHGISVSNGTVALQLAVAVLELEPGDEIIMPTFTIISCAVAALYNGCVPVVVDSHPGTWCIDTEKIEERLTSRTRAIMPVHIYGHPVDMDPVLEIAQRHDLRVIEDAAEAHGAAYLSNRGSKREDWVTCGGMGDLSTFSFYANKLVTTGEGGMIVTDDKELADRARSRRNLAFQPDRRFFHETLGFNFRLTNMQAALGLAQLERVDHVVARKREIADLYRQALQTVEEIQLPPSEDWAKSVYWMYGIVLRPDVEMDAAELARRLAGAGIESRPFFLGLHEQPALHDLGLFRGDRHPVSEALARRGLYLPSSVSLTPQQIEFIAEKVAESVA